MKEQPQKAIPCLVYSRVCGYYRPTENWNVGKLQEFKDRKYFDTSFQKLNVDTKHD